MSRWGKPHRLPAWTGNEVAHVRGALGLSVATMAQACGLSTATLYRWESMGCGEIPVMDDRRLLDVAALVATTTTDAERRALAQEMARGGLYATLALLRAFFTPGASATAPERPSSGA